jgi:multidrug efflux pump subunit AcrA (membrane-fusion protein)
LVKTREAGKSFFRSTALTLALSRRERGLSASLQILAAILLFSWPVVLCAAEKVTVPACVLSPDEEVQAPAQEDGVLVKVLVREGQRVSKGDLLAQIDDVIPRMQCEVSKNKLKVAEKQAADNISIRYAEAAAAVAYADYIQAMEANAKLPGTVPQAEVRQKALKHREMVLSIEKAQKEFDVAGLQLNVSKAELEAAEANLKRRRVLAPLDGEAEVVELKSHEGEWVKAGDVVLRLVRLDLLRVHGLLDANAASPAEVQGRPVEISVDLARGRHEKLMGKIVYVKPLVEGNGYEVRAEVQNRRENGAWLLNPGMLAEMTIQLK